MFKNLILVRSQCSKSCSLVNTDFSYYHQMVLVKLKHLNFCIKVPIMWRHTVYYFHSIQYEFLFTTVKIFILGKT